MKQRMDQLLDEAWEKFDLQQRVREGGSWKPATDAYETQEQYVIQMELPGLSKDEVSVELREGELTISGQRSSNREEGRFSHQVLERSFGPFSRRFRLPQGTDPEGIRARLHNGLLVVLVPKTGSGQGRRRIEVVQA
jgi:HSP20 family protein